MKLLKELEALFNRLHAKWGLSGTILIIYCFTLGVVVYSQSIKMDTLHDQVKGCQQEQVIMLKEVVQQNTKSMNDFREELRFQKNFYSYPPNAK